jgi:hypothetical protein
MSLRRNVSDSTVITSFYWMKTTASGNGWLGHRVERPRVARGRGQLKCDGTRTETRFRLSAKRTSPFKSAGASVQSTTGSRRVRISGSNGGYTMFRGSVKSTGCPLHSLFSPSLPLQGVTVCKHMSARLDTVLNFAVSSRYPHFVKG